MKFKDKYTLDGKKDKDKTQLDLNTYAIGETLQELIDTINQSIKIIITNNRK